MNLLTLHLSPHEVRALLRASELSEVVLSGISHDHPCPLPEGHTVRPIGSAMMKLELALLVEQEPTR